MLGGRGQRIGRTRGFTPRDRLAETPRLPRQSIARVGSEPQELDLPGAPARPTIYLDDPSAPQPRRHRDLDKGMAATIGRLQPCPVLGWKFVCLTHNTLRGAAGGALLAAELAVAQGHLSYER